jgi:hypothetical protein
MKLQKISEYISKLVAVLSKSLTNLKEFQFKYLYSIKSTAIFCFSVPLAIFLAIVITLPKWFFEQAQQLFEDYYPQCLKVKRNPEWEKQWQARQLKEYTIRVQMEDTTDART